MNSLPKVLTMPIVVPEKIKDPFRTVLSSTNIPAIEKSLAQNFFEGAGVKTSPVILPATPRDIRQRMLQIEERYAELDKKAADKRFRVQNLSVVQKPERALLDQTYIHCYMADKGFPVSIDMKFLRKSQENGYPMFGVLAHDDPECTISVEKVPYEDQYITRFVPNLPDDLSDLYSGHVENIKKLFDYRTEKIVLSTMFAGEIPEPLLEFMWTSLNSSFFQNIFLVFGKVNWNTEIIESDPLVIGRVVWEREGLPPVIHYSLLGMFDITDEEMTIINGFTSGV